MTPSTPSGGRSGRRAASLVVTVVTAGLLVAACSGEGITSQPLPLSASATTVRATTTTSMPAAGSTTRRSATELAPFQGDGFTVLMPGTPERSEQSAASGAGTVKVVLYTSESRNRAYLVGYSDLPAGATIDLPGAIKGAAAGVNGTVNDEMATTHQGFPARDARITDADDGSGNKGTAFLRVIDADERLYQIQYIQAGGDVQTPAANYREFVGSLKIG